MKKKVLSVALATVFAGVAGTSNAAMSITTDGVGQILYVPYFSTQNGNTTLLNLVNGDTVRGKAVKIRFRSAYDSDDIYDFQVFLSPADVWTANISKNPATGLSMLTTTDKSCTLPVNLNADFVTSRLNPALSAEGKANQTREGYIEILTMADIQQDYPSDAPPTGNAQLDSLFFQIKHANGVAPCNISVIGAIEANAARWDAGTGSANGTDGAGVTNTTNTTSELAFVGHNGVSTFVFAGSDATADLTMPTSALSANWTIINVPQAKAWGGGALSIDATDALGNLETARIVYSNQTNVGLTATDGGGLANVFPFVTGTADGVLLSDSDSAGGNFSTFHNDIPDLSTPYGVSQTTAVAQADALSLALQVSAVANEYLTLDDVSEETDWVVSLPTRRYHVAGRGRTADGVVSTTSGFYNPIDKGGPTGPFRNPNYGQQDVTEYDTDGRGAKVKLGSGAYTYWDREERKPAVDTGIVISPTPPSESPVVRLPGEVTVVGINQSGSSSAVLGANVAYTSLGLAAGYIEGWAILSLTHTSNGWVGLPAVGQAFVSAIHPQVSAGVSGGFGANWNHRYVKSSTWDATTFWNERTTGVHNGTSLDHP